MEDKKIAIMTCCPICGESDYVMLPEKDYVNYLLWQQGKLLIQQALPNVPASEREQLKTGICSHCWDKMFGGKQS